MSENEREMTLGEKRVRLNFNPNANPDVEQIKRKTAELIDICNQISAESFDGEVKRLAGVAMTHYEDAAMWAVKAVTG